MTCCIRLYKYFISPVMGNHCRFYPSCSTYSYNAIKKFGLVRGIWLSVCRMVKCHPWHEGGYDPLPFQLNSKD